MSDDSTPDSTADTAQPSRVRSKLVQVFIVAQPHQKSEHSDPGGIYGGWAMLSMLSGSQFNTHITARDDCGAFSG